MTKRELIEALEKSECPDDAVVEVHTMHGVFELDGDFTLADYNTGTRLQLEIDD